MSVLLVCPTEREARALRGAAVAVGTGRECADRLQTLIRERGASGVLILGVCGGLDPSLRPGDLILGRAVLARAGEERRPSQLLLDAARRSLRRAGISFVSSRIYTAARPIGSRRAKVKAWNEFGAAGVDLESYWLAEAADRAGLPWLVVRAVVDPADWALPPSLAEWASEADSARALRAAALRPWEWPAYVRLATAWARAERNLRRAVPPLRDALTHAPEEVPLLATQ